MSTAAYIERTCPDQSGITLLYDSQQPGQPLSAALHRHRFFEAALVERGSCKVLTGRSHLLLIPGDLLLLPPERPHACLPQKDAQVCLCQFEPELVPSRLTLPPENMVYWDISQTSAARKRLHDLSAFAQTDAGETGADPAGPPDIFRLTRAEFTSLHAILQSIAREQDDCLTGFEEMKRLRLQEFLILLRRIHLSQLQPADEQTSWKEEMAGAVLTQIDQNLAHGVDFDAIAREQGVTLSYFRTIFKEITGLSPTDYLGRIRILHALELLQTSDVPVAEIGRKVGICDANYFSRLFKKVTGYPPRYFKSIPRPSDDKTPE